MTTSPGEEVRLARRARGLSQAQLGALAGVDAGTVGRIERGIGEPTKLGKVQSFLGIGPYASDAPVQPLDVSNLTDDRLVSLITELIGELSRRLPRSRDETAPSGIVGASYDATTFEGENLGPRRRA